MNRYVQIITLMILSACLLACNGVLLKGEKAEPKLCTPQWYQHIEEKIGVTDEYGHGPDIGSLEWKYSVEHKLGVHGKDEVPDTQSKVWCTYIHQLLEKHQ